MILNKNSGTVKRPKCRSSSFLLPHEIDGVIPPGHKYSDILQLVTILKITSASKCALLKGIISMNRRLGGTRQAVRAIERRKNWLKLYNTGDGDEKDLVEWYDIKN